MDKNSKLRAQLINYDFLCTLFANYLERSFGDRPIAA